MIDQVQLQTIRRANLQALMRDRGDATLIAKRAGMRNASYLYQLAGPMYSRSITDNMASRIEKGLDLRRGYLDRKNRGTVVLEVATIKVPITASKTPKRSASTPKRKSTSR